MMKKNKSLVERLYILSFTSLICLSFFISSASSAPSDPWILRTINPQVDTFVSSGQPTSSFPNDIGLWIGNRNFDNWGNQRSLLKFEIPTDITTTTTITTATLGLYVAAWPGNNQPLDGQAYLTKSNWDGNITWNDTAAIIDNNVAPAAVTIPAVEGLQNWNVSTLLQSWINDPARSKYFGILIQTRSVTVNQFRGFWSNECPIAQCDGKQPKLIIDYATATPTATPTNTPSPTPTGTPTPGIKTIRLGNEPRGALAGGDIVVYTIELQNGIYSLSNVVVSNTLPEETELLRESIEAPPGWRVEVTGRTIKWQRTTLAVNDSAVVSYRAQRHTPTPTLTPTPTATMIVTAPTTPATTVTETPATPTPTATATLPAVTVTPSLTPAITPTASPTGGNFTITKTGPDVVAVGATIRYVLVVKNPFTRTLTGLTIADLIPVGAEVVDFGGGAITMPPSPMIQWQAPLLSAQGSVTRTFAIRPSPGSSQVMNDLYFVDVVENGVLRMRAVGKEPVVTTIIGGGLAPRPFALLSPTAPLTASLPIINSGAVVTWEYPGYDNQLASNRVSNPFQLYLPFVPRR